MAKMDPKPLRRLKRRELAQFHDQYIKPMVDRWRARRARRTSP